jgi:AcrR family transcriptional regulator
MKNLDNHKFQQIIRTAKELFWKFGIKRVSIEEICKEASVSKMTFYKHFSNKTELVKYIIDKITSEAMAKYKSIMSKKISFQEKVRLSIQLKIEQTDEMSQEFYADYYKNADPELLDFLNQKTHETLQMILNDYTDAQKRGDVRQNIKPEFILYFLNQMMIMAKDEELAKFYKTPQDLIMELINFFFYGILPHKRNA